MSSSSLLHTSLDLEGGDGLVRRCEKGRLIWSSELHEMFLSAVDQLGVQTARPQAILKLMGVDGLTPEHIKSHLQKYRAGVRQVVAGKAPRRSKMKLVHSVSNQSLSSISHSSSTSSSLSDLPHPLTASHPSSGDVTLHAGYGASVRMSNGADAVASVQSPLFDLSLVPPSHPPSVPVTITPMTQSPTHSTPPTYSTQLFVDARSIPADALLQMAQNVSLAAQQFHDSMTGFSRTVEMLEHSLSTRQRGSSSTVSSFRPPPATTASTSTSASASASTTTGSTQTPSFASVQQQQNQIQ
eukprot:c12161_g2_i1.p1 GENE.c12161_g2_i1~~c12161_g2_i1.p1  ORF type:complete len:298 (-),score=84.53 c12161_g2_i1:451-1344(-)